MMTEIQERCLEYFEERGHPTGGVAVIRKAYQGLREMQTIVVRGEYMFKSLADLTRFPKPKGQRSITLRNKFDSIVVLRAIGAIHYYHDGINHRVRTQRGLSGEWGPQPKVWRM